MSTGLGARALLAVAVLWAGPVAGHDVKRHGGPAVTGQVEAAPNAPLPADLLPFGPFGPFALTGQDGIPRTEGDFRGRAVLAFYGYTDCPNTCGLAMARIMAAYDELGSDGARIAPVFVSIDPEADTVAKVAAFVAGIHPALEGLTGSPEAVAALMATARIEAAPPEPRGGYARVIDHTSLAFLYGPDGVLLTILPPMFPPERTAEVIRGYLR